jgi:hypothetical protein
VAGLPYGTLHQRLRGALSDVPSHDSAILSCRTLRSLAFETNKGPSDGFDTHFAGSPLFAVATLSYLPTLVGVTTTTTLQQRSSCPLTCSIQSCQQDDQAPRPRHAEVEAFAVRVWRIRTPVGGLHHVPRKGF